MAAHRYWRIAIVTTSGLYGAFKEIELRTSASGSDETGAGTASASSVYSSSYTAAKAVDDSKNVCESGNVTIEI
jgi:hypothetical protein